MGNFFAKHGLTSVIALKIIVLGYIFFGDKINLQIGEKKLIGAEKTSEQPTETTPSDSKENPPSAETTEAPARRGFLDDLLESPKIDPKNMKKDEVGRYLTLLERKQSQIDSRLQVLNNREDSLKKLESSLDDKIKKIEEEMAFFQQSVQKEKELQGERLDKLIEFYQKMEPKKAAVVFEKLDKDLIVQLFNRFPQKQTTQILSLMNPERSVELSEYYGRIRSGKEYELLKEVNASLRKEFAECKGMPEKVQ